MSKRAVTKDDQAALLNLINILGINLDENTQKSALKNIEDNQKWLNSEKYSDVTSYIEDYLKKLDEFENQLRLPTASIPERYRLHIDARNVHLGLRGFEGEVEIDVLVKEKTDYIMLHSKNQVVGEVRVTDRSGSEILILDHSLHKPADTLTIYLKDELEAGSEITVSIQYMAFMFTYEAGFYQTYYTDSNGDTKYLGATQFQATDARFAFPCYDEPALKAVFDLKITHDRNYGAIANTMGATVNK